MNDDDFSLVGCAIQSLVIAVALWVFLGFGAVVWNVVF
jgi:hypothetical protein